MTNEEQSNLIEQMEQVVLKLLLFKPIPSKLVLIESISKELSKSRHMVASEEQINQLIDKMVQEKKIGFQRTGSNSGWKVII